MLVFLGILVVTAFILALNPAILPLNSGSKLSELPGEVNGWQQKFNKSLEYKFNEYM